MLSKADAHYNSICTWATPATNYNKALIYLRAVAECYIEPSKLYRYLDARSPLHLTKKEIHSPKVKKLGLSGFRILHLSDLHFDGSRKMTQRLFKTIKGQSVDLIVLTGDYHKGQSDHKNNALIVNEIKHAISETTSRLGVFATLGNHDNGPMINDFEAAGIRMLTSHSTHFSKKNVPIILSGKDSIHAKPSLYNETPFVEKIPNDLFGIILRHTPDKAKCDAVSGYGLCLTGHTHGPQIPIDALRRLTVSDANADKASGLWQEGSMTGHTSNGIGTSLLPIRLGRPAEATILTLK